MEAPLAAHPVDIADNRTVLRPLPSLAHLPEAGCRQIVVDMIRKIEEETLARHKAGDIAPMGVIAILNCDPNHRAKEIKTSPWP